MPHHVFKLVPSLGDSKLNALSASAYTCIQKPILWIIFWGQRLIGMSLVGKQNLFTLACRPWARPAACFQKSVCLVLLLILTRHYADCDQCARAPVVSRLRPAVRLVEKQMLFII